MTEKQLDYLRKIHENLGAFIDESSGVPESNVIEFPEKSNDVTKTRGGATSANKKGKKTPIVEDSEIGVNGYTAEQLEELGFNGMKKLAKELGFDAKGDRAALLNMLMNETPNEADEEESSAPVKKTRGEKTVEPEEIDEGADADDIEAQVNNAVEGFENDDLIAILEEAGVKVPKNGKRQSLIAAIVKAVRSGDLELGEEEIDSDEDEAPEAEDDEFAVNDFENPDMTDERKAALESYIADLKASVKSGEITKKDMKAFIKDFNGSDVGIKDASNKELRDWYIQIACLFVDDDGEIAEEDCYYVNSIPYCCGKPLAFNDDADEYVCDVCGTVYPTDDDED